MTSPLFLENGRFILAVMDILMTHQKSFKGIHFVLDMTESYLKVKRAIMMSNVLASHKASLLVENLVILYVTSKQVLTDTGMQ